MNYGYVLCRNEKHWNGDLLGWREEFGIIYFNFDEAEKTRERLANDSDCEEPIRIIEFLFNAYRE